MLTLLNTTDLLANPPDVDAIDLFATGRFDWSKIPSQPGCYAFYEAATGLVVYIGSAAATGVDVFAQGIRMRMRCYRGNMGVPSGTVVKVRAHHAKSPLLLRCWVAHSPGDARKYEDDAIRRHLPALNFLATRFRTPEENRAIKRGWATTAAARPKLIDPVKLVKCTRCKRRKTRDEFSPSKWRRTGLKVWCKLCICEARAEKTGRLTHQARRAIKHKEKRCYGCKATKPIKEFGKDKTGIGGRSNYCLLCRRQQSKKSRMKLKNLTE